MKDQNLPDQKLLKRIQQEIDAQTWNQVVQSKTNAQVTGNDAYALFQAYDPNDPQQNIDQQKFAPVFDELSQLKAHHVGPIASKLGVTTNEVVQCLTNLKQFFTQPEIGRQATQRQ